MAKKRGAGGNARGAKPPARPPLTVTRPALLVGGSDEKFRALVHDLFAFGARLGALRDAYADRLGLTGVQYTMLITVYHLGRRGRVGVRTVADHLHLSGAFTTIEIGKLATRGLLAKRIDTDDRRRVALRVTTAGRHLLDRFAPLQRRVNDVHFGAIDRAEFLTLCAAIPRLIASTEAGLALFGELAAGKSRAAASPLAVAPIRDTKARRVPAQSRAQAPS